MIKLLFMYEVQFKNIGGLETINKIFEQTEIKETEELLYNLIEIKPLGLCGFSNLVILERIARKLGLELNQILSHAKHSESHIKPTKYQIIKLLSAIQTT